MTPASSTDELERLGLIARAGCWPGPQGDGGGAPQLRAARPAAGLDGDAVHERGDEPGQGVRDGAGRRVMASCRAGSASGPQAWAVRTLMQPSGVSGPVVSSMAP